MADNSLCKIEGCGKRLSARGLCQSHYRRFKKYGDPLAGRAARGEPQKYLREVVLKFSGDECLTWPYTRASNGYGQVFVSGKMVGVHVLACEHINGPRPDGYEASHNCGKGREGCCNPHHMSWKTRAENHADKIVHGTHLEGERHYKARLSEADVHAIRALRKEGHLYREIGERFGVTESNIQKIINGRIWRGLPVRSS